MNKKTSIILALQQLDNLEKLTEDFDYRNYLYSKIVEMRCELRRQLSHLTADVTCDI